MAGREVRVMAKGIRNGTCTLAPGQTGLDALAGYPDGIPAVVGTVYADFVSAARGMVALLA